MKLFLFWFVVLFIINMLFLKVWKYGGLMNGLERTFWIAIISAIHSIIIVWVVTVVKYSDTTPIQMKIFLIWLIIIFSIAFFFGKAYINGMEVTGLSRILLMFCISVFLSIILMGISVIILGVLNIDLSKIII